MENVRPMAISFVDIHCHLLPGIDDGARNWDESLAMARLAVDDGIGTIVATPHQLGNYGNTDGQTIRALVVELQQRLVAARIPLRVLPGADVRIEPEIAERVSRGDVLTVGDHQRHVLLELPHELYLPLEPLLEQLSRRKVTGILTHPERNQGILRQPDVLAPLVEAGCLMQVTAGSLCGTFGAECQHFSEWLLASNLVHFLATDAHGMRSRRPLMRRAFDRVAELCGESAAIDLCSRNPGCVAAGQAVAIGRRGARPAKRGWGLRRTVA
jgi:protein-tyrosine phosphatase